MNLPDIELVVVYSLLIAMNLSGLMQRIVRAARAVGSGTGDGIIFLPYLLFSDSDYGENKPGQTPLPIDQGKTREKRRNDANLFLASASQI
jgi:hypothetical protein